jgi:hypothetical protein
MDRTFIKSSMSWHLATALIQTPGNSTDNNTVLVNKTTRVALERRGTFFEPAHHTINSRMMFLNPATDQRKDEPAL